MREAMIRRLGQPMQDGVICDPQIMTEEIHESLITRHICGSGDWIVAVCNSCREATVYNLTPNGERDQEDLGERMDVVEVRIWRVSRGRADVEVEQTDLSAKRVVWTLRRS